MSEYTKRLVIVGAGGHGRVVGDAVLSMIDSADTPVEFVGWIDPDIETGTAIFDRPVLGDDEEAKRLVQSGAITCFVIAIGSLVANSPVRRNLFDRYQEMGLEAATIIHPKTIIGRDVEIGAGTVVMAGVVINTGSTIGKNTIINTASSIDHDANIGDHVHIAPGVIVSGDVEIAGMSHIGTAACVRQGMKIGHGSTVGAGAAVIKDVADETTVIGVPAKPI